MDGLQHYSAHAAVVRPHHLGGSVPTNPAAVKTPYDYLRALRRRVWLVLLVAVPLSVASAVWTVRQKSVFQAKAQIKLQATRTDPILTGILGQKFERGDSLGSDKYLLNHVGLLKNRALAEEVLNDPAFNQGTVPDPEEAEDLANNLYARIKPGSDWVEVNLEGTDPARTARLLAAIIEAFTRHIKSEATDKNETPKRLAFDKLVLLKNQLKDIDALLLGLLQTTASINPDGTNILQSEYEKLGSFLMHKKMRLDEFQQQAWTGKLFPRDAPLTRDDTSRFNQIEKLQETRRKLTAQLREHRRIIRNYNSDAAVRHTEAKLGDVLQQIEELKAVPDHASLDPSESITATMQQEIQAAEEASKQVLGQLRGSMPEHTRFLTLKEERERKVDELRETQKTLSNLQMLSSYLTDPVKVPAPVAEPTVPIRPRRAINIAAGILLSLFLGIVLVCVLEHLDHSVKVPEHLTAGLTLPLLGVVPRIRRTALTQRGGHLWTAGAPESVEADAYRNLRASLLGASDRLGALGTLLVTSAKAGEGKSTTALNLAATCARAGERTLLVDVDLRRPSLADVFGDDESPAYGLVDVLKGTLPWQRTVVRSDLPNLDFLPTGDTLDIPIEILGTLELRQLLIGLSNHYDRVILDGPAVLGLADCRMLGRVVDAAVLVVRSGTHEMRPLQRAKAMLEQSGVVLAGVVFNGLYEDLQNWSSYGPYQQYGGEALATGPGRRALVGARRDDDEAALPLAGAGAR